MQGDKPLSEQIREKIQEFQNQKPDRDLAGKIAPEMHRVLNPDIDKEAFSETRQKYESQLHQINERYISDASSEHSEKLTTALSELNQTALPLSRSPVRGIKNKVRSLLTRIIKFALSEEFNRQEKLFSQIVQTQNFINDAFRETKAKQNEFNALLALFGQSIVPVIDEKVRYAYEILDKIIVDNIILVNTRMDLLHSGFDRRLAEILSYQKDTLEWLKNTDNDLKNVMSSFIKLEKETQIGIALQHKKIEQLKVPGSRLDVSLKQHPSNPIDQDFSYVVFENLNRGSEEAICEGQKRYVEVFRNTAPVLDVGCGRGEFLQLLKDSGVESRGVDTNPDMVELCRGKGLTVTHGEALAYLAEIQPESLGGIFAAQVIEHFPFAQFIEFIDRCFLGLRKGGILLLETVNTSSVYALTNHYFKDPSHHPPRHPETYQFYIQMAGFASVDLEYRNPPAVSGPPELTDLPDSASSNLPDFMKKTTLYMQQIHNHLFRDCDIVLIARK